MNKTFNDFLDNLSSEVLDELYKIKPTEKIDLKTKEGHDRFNTLCDELKHEIDSDIFLKSIFNNDIWIEGLKDLANRVYKNSQPADTTDTTDTTDTADTTDNDKCDKNCTSCDKDYCVHEEVTGENDTDEQISNEIDKNESFGIPSSKIENIDTKMQIHRLTQEYVDTMLKPYMEKGENTTNNINNAYTALFEFACWIYSHK